MRTFVLQRIVDHSGVAGTGIVAEGVEFSNGMCVLRWKIVPHGMNYVPKGVGIYESIAHVVAVHGHGGDTVVEWNT